MKIDRLPDRGGSVKASAAMSRPGSGFTTLSAAAAMGVSAAAASPLGTGPNSYTVRQQLAEAGVRILTEELVGDIGVGIQLIEADGSMTAVVTAGVESEPSRAALDAIVLQPGDVIHISGVDLTSPASAVALAGWGAGLPSSVRLVVSISPAVNQVPFSAWQQLLRRADVVTMNIREAAALTKNLSKMEAGTGVRHLMRPESTLVRRLGVMGCEVQTGIDQERVQIPAFTSDTVDTAGVADTHVAVMCAAMLEGKDMVEACRWANAAAAIAISHESALPVPTRSQVEAVLEHGGVPEQE
ncbi:bifunctional hydroxymethylpyrimidine kinase/phosphomethylpyrimidine kinase [Schaalia sp. 19OD2882]|uniref:PfkB family carbohydrate kinase n=1 Tax=Schaalia sp. 19OD2882 TaxID=2794089 RepID=UPI001C1F1CD1|nr:PfkB family carbohydrate kinase [Schaalia sp. 19OD2882]QWW20706.1 bifunctional hydroxymethylpyrimidine kinase/phosphomethylpyrimidine kinase [Schaalia sp. 19OD2882]